jgi:Ca-activated chloride channel homolog
MRSHGGRCMALGAVVALGMMAEEARAQGIIIDVRRPGPVAGTFEIREVRIDARVRDQVAEVQVSQTFHNPGSFQIESEYLFPLPDEGAVQDFVLMVDGREMPGKLMSKEEARRIYEEIVRTKRDPALLEYMGRGLFKTSVFPIPPHADRKVTMRYTQVCRRDRDVVEFSYPLGTQKFTSKPIQRLELEVRIESREPIKNVYSPSYDAQVDRRDDHEARARVERRDVVPTADFRLLYTLASGPFGATVLSYRPTESDDGYFLLLASPEVRQTEARPRPKTVVFVLDRSGSMAGKKIDQARRALRFVLDNLRDDDLFNIVAFDDRVEAFKPELQRFSSDARREAERFVENIREGGSTNIDDALTTALGMIRDDLRPNYVLFLTDGLPTAGERGEMAIADHARRENRHRARLFAFGVGFEVNARLLDRLSGGNAGTSEYVKPDEDIEAHVSRFYAKLTSPVLTDIRIELSGTDVNRTYPRDIPDLFEGGQLVWAGRYRRSGLTTVVVSGRLGDDRRRFEFPAELARPGRGEGRDYVERIWAIRRIGDIIDQIDLHGRNSELIDELVALSTRYGILTPYTSFLADDRVMLHARAANAGRAEESLRELGKVTGQEGIVQRDMKRAYQNAAQAPAPSEYRLADAPRSGGPMPKAAAPAAPGNPGAGLPTIVTATPGAPADNLSPFTQGRLRGMGRSSGGGTTPGQPNLPGMSFGLAVAGPDAQANPAVAASVRQVGSKTFYYKDNRWIDSTVKPEDDAKAVVIAQFSDKFFDLARSQTAEMNQYLTFTEPVTVNLDGRVYRFDPPSP